MRTPRLCIPAILTRIFERRRILAEFLLASFAPSVSCFSRFRPELCRILLSKGKSLEGSLINLRRVRVRTNSRIFIAGRVGKKGNEFSPIRMSASQLRGKESFRAEYCRVGRVRKYESGDFFILFLSLFLSLSFFLEGLISRRSSNGIKNHGLKRRIRS